MRAKLCDNVTMPNIDEGAKTWQIEQAGRIGAAVRAGRKRLGITALQLTARTEAFGYPVSRVAISKIESNTRAGKFDISELLVLAAALDVPPMLLLYPQLPYGHVEFLPGVNVLSYEASDWFSGDAPRRGDPSEEISDREAEALELIRRIRWSSEQARAIGRSQLEARQRGDDIDVDADPKDPAAIAMEKMYAAARENDRWIARLGGTIYGDEWEGPHCAK